MTANGWFQIGLYLFVIFLVTKPIGVFMTRVFNREKTFLDPIFRPVERLVYRLTGVDEKHEMRWTEYAVAMLLFSGVSMLLLYLMMRVQQWLPANPQGVGRVAPDIAFIRGIAQKEKDTLGNFWVDLVRCTLWLLLPFCLVGSLVLMSQGVVQNL